MMKGARLSLHQYISNKWVLLTFDLLVCIFLTLSFNFLASFEATLEPLKYLQLMNHHGNLII